MANPSYAQSEKRGDQTERVRVTWMDSVGRMTFLGTENKIMVVFRPREWDVTEPSFRRQGWDPLVQRGTKRLRCGTRYGSAFSDWVSREKRAVGRNRVVQRFQSADAEIRPALRVVKAKSAECVFQTIFAEVVTKVSRRMADCTHAPAVLPILQSFALIFIPDLKIAQSQDLPTRYTNHSAVLFWIQLSSIRDSFFCKIILHKSQAPCSLPLFFRIHDLSAQISGKNYAKLGPLKIDHAQSINILFYNAIVFIFLLMSK